MIFLSTYRNKRRWIAAAGMTIWLMSAYVWMLDESQELSVFLMVSR